MTTEAVTTGCYLVACPALNEREVVCGSEYAIDVAYSMHNETGKYVWIEDWLGHTHYELGDPFE